MPAREDAYRYSSTGVVMRRETLHPTEARKRLMHELQKAKDMLLIHPYAKEKAESVSRCRDSIDKSDGRDIVFGYELGTRPPYGGLPLGLFSNIDPAIGELMDKLAKSSSFAFTGQCCSGHVCQYWEGDGFDLGLQAPYFMLLFYPDEWKENLRERLWLSLEKVDQAIETPKARLRLHNHVQAIRLDGAQTDDSTILPRLKIYPILERPPGNSMGEEISGPFLELLCRYWDSVVEAITDEVSIGQVRRMEPGFFTRMHLWEGGRRCEYVPEK